MSLLRSKLLQLSIDLLISCPTTESNLETFTTSSRALVEHFLPRLPLHPTTTLQSVLSEAKVSPAMKTTSNEDRVFAMPIQLSSHINLDILPINRPQRAKPYYPPLDSNKSLESQLAGKGFIEFPTIEVFTHSEWLQYLEEGLAVVIEVGSDDEESDDGLGDGKRLRDSGWGSRATGVKLGMADETEQSSDVVVLEEHYAVVSSDQQPDRLQSMLGDYGSESEDEE